MAVSRRLAGGKGIIIASKTRRRGHVASTKATRLLKPLELSQYLVSGLSIFERSEKYPTSPSRDAKTPTKPENLRHAHISFLASPLNVVLTVS